MGRLPNLPNQPGSNKIITIIDNNNQQQDEEPKLKKRRKQPWQAIPTSSHYHVSLMHRDIVTHAVSSEKHGYVVTASQDGVVKFWKRMTIDPIHNKEDNDDNDKSAVSASAGVSALSPCLEFVLD